MRLALLAVFLLLFLPSLSRAGSCIFENEKDARAELNNYQNEYRQLKTTQVKESPGLFDELFNGAIDRLSTLEGCRRKVRDQLGARLATFEKIIPKLKFPLGAEECDRLVAIQDRTYALLVTYRQLRLGAFFGDAPTFCRGAQLKVEYRDPCVRPAVAPPLAIAQQANLAHAEEAVQFMEGDKNAAVNIEGPRKAEESKPEEKLPEKSKKVAQAPKKPNQAGAPRLDPKKLPAAPPTESALVQQADQALLQYSVDGTLPDHPGEFLINAEVRGFNDRLLRAKAQGKRLDEKLITQAELEELRKKWPEMVRYYGDYVKGLNGTEDEKLQMLANTFFDDHLKPYIRSNSGIHSVIKKLGGNCHSKARIFYSLVKEIGLEPEDGKKYGFYYVNGEHQELIVYKPNPDGQPVDEIWQPLHGNRPNHLQGSVFDEGFLYRSYNNKRRPSSRVRNAKHWVGGRPEGTPSLHKVDPNSMEWYSELASPVAPDGPPGVTPYSPPYGAEAPPSALLPKGPTPEPKEEKEKAPYLSKEIHFSSLDTLPQTRKSRALIQFNGNNPKPFLTMEFSDTGGTSSHTVFRDQKDADFYGELLKKKDKKKEEEFLLGLYEKWLKKFSESDELKKTIEALSHPEQINSTNYFEIDSTIRQTGHTLLINENEMSELGIVKENKSTIHTAWIEKYPQLKHFIEAGNALGDHAEKDPKSFLAIFDKNLYARELIVRMSDFRKNSNPQQEADGQKNGFLRDPLKPIYDLLKEPNKIGIQVSKSKTGSPTLQAPPSERGSKHANRLATDESNAIPTGKKAEIEIKLNTFFWLLTQNGRVDASTMDRWDPIMSAQFRIANSSGDFDQWLYYNFPANYLAAARKTKGEKWEENQAIYSPRRDPIPLDVAVLYLDMFKRQLSATFPIAENDPTIVAWGGKQGYIDYLESAIRIVQNP